MIKTLNILLKQDKERFVVPKGVQDVIPVKAIYDDGIFQVGRDKFTRWRKYSQTRRNTGLQPNRENGATPKTGLHRIPFKKHPYGALANATAPLFHIA